jgi:hypothetical protein
MVIYVIFPSCIVDHKFCSFSKYLFAVTYPKSVVKIVHNGKTDKILMPGSVSPTRSFTQKRLKVDKDDYKYSQPEIRRTLEPMNV